MSKNRFRPIMIPEKIKIEVSNGKVKVAGPLGNLEQTICPKVKVVVEESKVLVHALENTKQAASQQGTMRSLIINMVDGVLKEFEKTLIIEGTGYRAQMSGAGLQLFLGYVKPKTVAIPKDVKCELKVVKSAEKGDLTYITLKGIDKQKVGDIAALVKKTKKPDPYKHKGVRYADEILKKKIGKRAVVQA
ncbi:MAG: 50S ribosomal protein L6 [candidate division WOR-3 bacterium]|nr:MAG: 50S ribosomal protein L6 [candidate division WOR-3 bacterium]